MFDALPEPPREVIAALQESAQIAGFVRILAEAVTDPPFCHFPAGRVTLSVQQR
ncbi:MAG: hypothetical protein WC383_11715 [Gammaproteobacteria bacterium]